MVINKKDIEIVKDVIPFLEFPVFFITTILFLFFPLQISIFSSVLIYLLLLYIEKSIGRITPTVILMFFVSLVLLVLFLLNYEAVFPYIGSIFYFSLFLLNFILLLVKKPVTMFYSGGKGWRRLHLIVSVIWTMGSFLAGILSLVLMPDISYIVVPFIIIFVCLLMTILFEFFFFPGQKRRKVFEVDNILFKQVSNSREYEDFYDLVSKEIYSTIMLNKNRYISSKSELRNVLIESDKKYEKHLLRFVAYKEGVCIGTIYCVLDNKEVGLPIERDTGIKFDNIKKYGKFMEIGHLCIHSKMKFSPQVLIGLLTCVIEYAIENDICFLVNSSYESVVPLYYKIGFEKIVNSPIIDKVIGVNVFALILNLSKIICYYQSLQETFSYISKMREMLNQYLLERYYKRTVIRNIFKKFENKQYNLTKEELIYENIYQNVGSCCSS